MKTLTQIQEEVSLRRFGCALSEALPRMDFMDIIEFLNDTSYAYATEAIKADRERVIGVLCYPLGYIDGEIQNADRILNLPIELP